MSKEAMTEQMDGNTVRWFATGLLRHELSHPEQERAASLLMRLYDRGKGNEPAASDPPPVPPPLGYSAQGISYVHVCSESAIAVEEWLRSYHELVPGPRLGANLTSLPAALRALAKLMAEAEKARADLAANVSTQGDAVYEYEMACHALIVDLSSGFHVPSGAVGK